MFSSAGGIEPISIVEVPVAILGTTRDPGALSKFKPSHDTPIAVKPRAKKPRASLPGSVENPLGVRQLQPDGTAADAVLTDAETDEAPPNLFQRLGFWAAALFVFFRFSYLHEFLSTKLGLNLHLIIVLGSLSYLGCLLSGRLGVAFRSKITWLWIGFAGLMCVATATSYWKGGSFPFLIAFLDSSLPIVVVIPAVVASRKDVSRLINTIGVACIVMVLLGALNKDFKAGRMNIDARGSDIQDPNDYAAHVILMLPALAYLTLRPGKSIVSKGVGILFIAIGLQQILSTGSRGGLTSLALTTIYVLIVGSARVKAGLLVGIPVLALAAVPFIPSTAISRLGTLFSAETPQATEATESSEQRMALLVASIQVTLQHPMLGVGPGVFMDYQADQAKQGGQKGLWHVTHNSYTQVSSECGLAAFLLYLSALVLTYRSLRVTSKTASPELSTPALFVMTMLVGFGFCMFFLSMAYNVHILVLSGLAIALQYRNRSNEAVLPVPDSAYSLPATPVTA